MSTAEQNIEQYARQVYLFMLRLTGNPQEAEEFTQEALYRACVHADRYDGSCKPSVWLCQIAKNAWFDHLRRKKALPLPASAPAPDNLEDRLADHSEAKRIHIALHMLEEPYKEVFTLRVFGELPYADIAALFGKSESWARVVYYRAKEKIIKKLQ